MARHSLPSASDMCSPAEPRAAIHGPGQVDSGGPCPGQSGPQPLQFSQQGRTLPPPRLQLTGQGIQAVPGKDSNGRGAPDPQGADGLYHLGQGTDLPFLQAVGQLGLIQQDNAVFSWAQPDMVWIRLRHVLPPPCSSWGVLDPDSVR